MFNHNQWSIIRCHHWDIINTWACGLKTYIVQNVGCKGGKHINWAQLKICLWVGSSDLAREGKGEITFWRRLSHTKAENREKRGHPSVKVLDRNPNKVTRNSRKIYTLWQDQGLDQFLDKDEHSERLGQCIHSKSEKVCVLHFSVSKNLRKKCVNHRNHKNLVSMWHCCWEYSVF